MREAFRYGVLGAMVALLSFAGWRVFGQLQAERLAAGEPERALAWRPHDPRALLVLAERQLAQGKPAPAQATARKLLRSEPLQGQAFRLLAEAASREGRQADALALYRIAARRAPRDMPARVWLTQYDLDHGNYPQALEQIDRILRMSPQRVLRIGPLLARLAQDPEFADALADALQANPPWRQGVLTALRDPQTGDRQAEGRVMQSLRARGGLSQEEYFAWLDSLIAQGRWGEAYARWAGVAVVPGETLPLVYNGDFARTPSGAGFDWRWRRVPGVLIAFEQVAGTRGTAAYLRFLDRQVADAGLEHPLLLQPGQYRLRMRMRAQGLRSALGLHWQVVCEGGAIVVAQGRGVDGSFGWRSDDSDLVIPPEGCLGQWLRLVNPVQAGAAQQVGGELWVDDVAIEKR